MRRSSFKILVSIWLSLFPSFLFSQQVNSVIKEVILFPNQALIKREAQLKAKKGLNEILLEINAFNVDKDSVSAKVYGEGEIYSVQFKEIFLKEPPQKKIRELENKLKNLRVQKESLLSEKNVLEKKEEFLNSFINFSHAQIPKDLKTKFPSISDLENVLKFLEENLTKINKRRQGLNLKIEDLNEEIEVLEKELNSLRALSEKSRKVIQILFNSKKDQEIKVEASYLVYNCRWQPFYKIDVPLNLKELNLVTFSKITQRTGEDWEDVTLSISNVIPLRGMSLPSLSSWFLDVGRDAYSMNIKGAISSKIAKFPRRWEGLQEEKELPQAAGFVYARKKELPLSFEYTLPQKLNIESKDKETILPLFQKTLKGDFFYYTVPKANSYVYLVCKVQADKELLSGILNVYFGGRFIGKTYLAEKKPGQEFYINLGVDRAIKVKKEKIKDKIKETFFGKIERKTVIRELAFKIIIENLKNEPIEIKVLDNIPISKTDRIQIKDVKVFPKPKEENYQNREGLNLWVLKIPPKGKKEIDVEFKITYPKDIQIFGL